MTIELPSFQSLILQKGAWKKVMKFCLKETPFEKGTVKASEENLLYLTPVGIDVDDGMFSNLL